MVSRIPVPTIKSKAGLSRCLRLAVHSLTALSAQMVRHHAKRKSALQGEAEYDSDLTVVKPGVRWIVTGSGRGAVSHVGPFLVKFFYDIDLLTGLFTGEVKAIAGDGDQFGGTIRGHLTPEGTNGVARIDARSGRFAKATGLADFAATPTSLSFDGAISTRTSKRKK